MAVIGAAMLVATGFAPHTEWSSWLAPATFVVGGRSSSFSASMRGVPRADITIQAAEVGGSCRHGVERHHQPGRSVSGSSREQGSIYHASPAKG